MNYLRLLGSKLAVTFLGHYPTIYTLDDPYPIAVCSGRHLPGGSPIPSGKRTYTNSCTMKVSSVVSSIVPDLTKRLYQHGCFGGPGLSDDIYYSAGSDDFCGYVWSIPNAQTLKLAREQFHDHEWPHLADSGTTGANDERSKPSFISYNVDIQGLQQTLVTIAMCHWTCPLRLRGSQVRGCSPARLFELAERSSGR